MVDQQTWENILSKLETGISGAAFKTWFGGTKLSRQDGEIFEITCPNNLTKSKIESTYLPILLKTLSNIGFTKPIVKVEVVKNVETITGLGPLFKDSSEPKEDGKAVSQQRNSPNLSPHYTFENFVVGANSRLAYAMATAAARSPGAGVNNPFFLYAAVGLGKTHLVQAIGNEILKNFPSRRVLYTTSENFTNELIDSIQHRTQKNFRHKFRFVDVLIVDDIQFIAGHESTQEEFFNTFNNLHLAQKQIIITSDRPPREITRLEQRLTSRFGGGIMADIQNPDLETRLAILKSKTESLNLKIPSQILEILAATIPSNIRELEGGLKQIVNLMLSQNGQISLVDVQNLFRQNYPRHDPVFDPQAVIENVCAYFLLRKTDLLGQRRTQTLVRPRQLAMFILRKIGQLPLTRVGEILGGKDHTTILHGVGKIELLLRTDPKIRQDLENLTKRLNGS